MPRGDAAERLRTELASFVAGTDRSGENVQRIRDLSASVDGLPWIDELASATKNFVPGDAENGEEALVALGKLALHDWSERRRWRRQLPPDAKALRRRWTDEAGRERARAVARALRSGNLGDLAFGVHEGRLDFRGFAFPDEDPDSRQAGDLVSVDFSGASLRWLKWTHATIRDSRFDGADLADAEVLDSTIAGSSFRGASLSHTVFFGSTLRSWQSRPGNRVADCDFTGANLGHVHAASETTFEQCDFADAWLVDAEFAAHLRRCRFKGHVEGLMIDGRDGGKGVRIEDLDFREADLELVRFRWVDLSGLILPDSPELRVVPDWPCVYARLARAAEELAELPSWSTKWLLYFEPEWTAGARRAQLVEVATLRRHDSTVGVTQALRLLDAAQLECRGAR